MKQDKQDRRSQRTRRLVSSAMTELLREKRYGAITVQDLLDRAGIGRSTFYTHCTSSLLLKQVGRLTITRHRLITRSITGCTRSLESLAHLLKGSRVNLPACIALPQDLLR